jgi:hypothetical protein
MVQNEKTSRLFYASWNFDQSPLAIIERYTVSPSNALPSTAIMASPVDTNILDLEVILVARYHLNTNFLLLLNLPCKVELLLVLLNFPSNHLGAAIRGLDFGLLDHVGVRDALVGRQKLFVEHSTRVLARELVGLGCWPENLLVGVGMDGEFVDRLVSNASEAVVRGLR